MAGDGPAIYLASASPRRSELLRQIDVTHAVRPVDIDETPRPGERPAHYALRLAEEKARVLWERLAVAERRPVLAADTTVALGDEILGKPADHADAVRILGRLSGRTHEVHTAVAVLHAAVRTLASAPARSNSAGSRAPKSTGTGTPASRPTRPARTASRVSPRCSFATSRAATPA